MRLNRLHRLTPVRPVQSRAGGVMTLVATLLVLTTLSGSASAGRLSDAATDPRVSTQLRSALAWADRMETTGPEALRATGARPEGDVVPGPGQAWATPDSDMLLVVRGSMDRAAIEARGGRVNTVAGDVMTVAVPLRGVPELLEIPAIAMIEMGEPVELQTDVSSRSINADDMWGGPPPMYSTAGTTGKGVVVGVVDTGIDVTHEDFRTEQGTRIRFLWDQGIYTGTPPTGFTYGAEYSAANLNAGLYTGADENGHGTHIAGIAAGNGRATGNGQPAYLYPGIAPEADLVIVKMLPTPAGVYTDTRIIDGVNYVFQKAAALGRPAVVLVAATKMTGPHDGSDYLDTALAGLSGPGRIIVTAAGNLYGKARHAEWTALNFDAVGDLGINIPAYTPSATGADAFTAESWHDATGNMEVSLIAPGGQTFGPVLRGAQLSVQSPSGIVSIKNGLQTSSNGSWKIEIMVYRGSTSLPQVAAGTWTCRFKSKALPQTRIDSWLTSNVVGTAQAVFAQGMTEARLIGSPATSDGAIAVAAYTTKRSWTNINNTTSSYFYAVMNQIASYSSPGPRRDGGLVPHVTAPGYGVAGAKSGAWEASSSFILRDGKHVISNGTSVAAAHVAGATALFLETRPQLTRAEMIGILESTAGADSYTGLVPNPRWGSGKLYLQQLAAAAVGESNPIVQKFRLAAWPNPTRGASSFRFDLVREAMPGPTAEVRVRIVDVSGREVALLRETLPEGPAEMTWDGRTRDGSPAAPGIYLARLEVGRFEAIRKLVRIP